MMYQHRFSALPALITLCTAVGCDATPEDAPLVATDPVAAADDRDFETDVGDESGGGSETGDDTDGDQIEIPEDDTIVLGETVVRGPEGPITVVYEDIEGVAVVDGDIELGSVEQLRTPAEFDAALALNSDDVQHAFTPAPVWGQHWPNGTVYYVAPTLSAATDTSINNAIAAMDSATDLTFVAISPFLSMFLDHIYFSSSWTVPAGNGRSNSVGRKGGRQYVTFSLVDVVGNSALSQGLVHHELGHAVGLYHEHQRLDRDDFVTVLWFCIQAGSEGNFEKRLGFPTGPYDTSSVMHYFQNNFSTAPWCPTLISKDGSPLGGNALSASDIVGLNWLAGLN